VHELRNFPCLKARGNVGNNYNVHNIYIQILRRDCGLVVAYVVSLFRCVRMAGRCTEFVTLGDNVACRISVPICKCGGLTNWELCIIAYCYSACVCLQVKYTLMCIQEALCMGFLVWAWASRCL
jgi:hypothetical protein